MGATSHQAPFRFSRLQPVGLKNGKLERQQAQQVRLYLLSIDFHPDCFSIQRLPF